MNGITRTREEAMNTIEIDCPWCAAEATVEAAATRTGAATFVCTDVPGPRRPGPGPRPARGRARRLTDQRGARLA